MSGTGFRVGVSTARAQTQGSKLIRSPWGLPQPLTTTLIGFWPGTISESPQAAYFRWHSALGTEAELQALCWHRGSPG